MNKALVRQPVNPAHAATMAAWRMWQEAANLSERTITERDRVIRQLLTFAGRGPLDLQPQDIINFLTRPGTNKTTRASYHASIRAYCAWLQATDQRADDPSRRTPTPKRPKSVPRPIEEAQLDAILARVNRRRTRMMILLHTYAGLRVHEIAKIRGEDIDHASGSIYVTGKGNKSAVLPMHERIRAESANFPARGWWFPAYDDGGGHIGPQAVGYAISRTMSRAGVHATAHQLRHWYGTTLVRRGTDLRTVQELMRHESLATTALYTEVSSHQRRAGIDTL